MTQRDSWQRWLLALLVAVVAGCGGGGSGNSSTSTASSTGSSGTTPAGGSGTMPVIASGGNVLAVRLDSGTDGSAVNSPYVSVTICAPGSATACQTIDHVLVDTASFGLRLNASVVNVALPNLTSPAGLPLAECAPFASGYSWGSVRSADVHLAGETAAAIPIQIVNDRSTSFATAPTACTSTGPNFGVGPGSNGILGVGLQSQDCGPPCAASAAPGLYFECSSGCRGTFAPLNIQVVNPVVAFATDNNGVVLVTPDVPVGGTGALDAQLIFGVGTQANNQLGTATVYSADSRGEFNTTYKGVTMPAFLDSGSNAYFLHDPGLTACLSSGFYCPPSPTTLSATIISATGVSKSVDFTVEKLAGNVDNARVAADSGGNVFDWGMPFFFGRTVFVAISGASTPAGVGPYWAF